MPCHSTRGAAQTAAPDTRVPGAGRGAPRAAAGLRTIHAAPTGAVLAPGKGQEVRASCTCTGCPSTSRTARGSGPDRAPPRAGTDSVCPQGQQGGKGPGRASSARPEPRRSSPEPRCSAPRSAALCGHSDGERSSPGPAANTASRRLVGKEGAGVRTSLFICRTPCPWTQQLPMGLGRAAGIYCSSFSWV